MSGSQFLYKSLDNPIRILFWSMDEFLVLATPFFLCLCFGNVLFLLGTVVAKPLYAKMKKKFPRGVFKHHIYWNLPKRALEKMGKIKRLPPSHCRELLL